MAKTFPAFTFSLMLAARSPPLHMSSDFFDGEPGKRMMAIIKMDPVHYQEMLQDKRSIKPYMLN